MKLWEAMLIGSKEIKPFKYSYRRWINNERCGCAIGTLDYENKQWGNNDSSYEKVNSFFTYLEIKYPELKEPRLCPECEGLSTPSGIYRTKTLLVAIECLYMNHDWSRQRIAEWLVNRDLQFSESKTSSTLKITSKETP